MNPSCCTHNARAVADRQSACRVYAHRTVPQVMSFFHYSRKCDKRTLSLPIEPLAGSMRHPFVIPACNPPVRLWCQPVWCEGYRSTRT